MIHHAVAEMPLPTGTQDPVVLETLERLRDEHPGWRVEYAPGKGVSWIAFRGRGDGWRGGFPAVVAETAEDLAYLIGQAIRQDAVLAARRAVCTEGCVR